MTIVRVLDLKSALDTLERIKTPGHMIPTSERTNAMVTVMLSMMEQQQAIVIPDDVRATMRWALVTCHEDGCVNYDSMPPSAKEQMLRIVAALAWLDALP